MTAITSRRRGSTGRKRRPERATPEEMDARAPSSALASRCIQAGVMAATAALSGPMSPSDDLRAGWAICRACSATCGSRWAICRGGAGRNRLARSQPGMADLRWDGPNRRASFACVGCEVSARCRTDPSDDPRPRRSLTPRVRPRRSPLQEEPPPSPRRIGRQSVRSAWGRDSVPFGGRQPGLPRTQPPVCHVPGERCTRAARRRRTPDDPRADSGAG